MKRKFVWASALALVVTAAVCVQTMGGVVMISTRKNVCSDWGQDDLDEKGPGMTTPGDVAMSTLLGDHGYSCRVILDALLDPDAPPPGGTPDVYLQPTDPNMAVDLVIWSGSSASADIPAPPPGIPLMMGEHVTLGNNPGRLGSIFMYNGTNSTDPNDSQTDNDGQPISKYMKVIAPDHPILAGIPLDAEGRVKIFREPYPEEELNVPTGGKKNFEYRWCTQVVADKAPGTTVLGLLDCLRGGETEKRSVLAVVEAGGMLANGAAATARMVQIMTNENGSGGSRRVFLALTELGRVIFVRAAKWAMGEELAPYEGGGGEDFGIVDITPAGGESLNLSWEGNAARTYTIQASLDAATWSDAVRDIAGTDGTITRVLDVSASPVSLFLRVAAE